MWFTVLCSKPFSSILQTVALVALILVSTKMLYKYYLLKQGVVHSTYTEKLQGQMQTVLN